MSLIISYQDGPVFFPFAVARKMGYFKQAGLSVKVVPTHGSSYVTQQILAGNADFGMANGPADIIAYGKNPVIRVPSCFQERLIYEIGMLKDSPVHSIKDLKGKVLGTTEVGSGEYPYADAVLKDAGLTPNKDVRYQPIGDGTAQTVKALRDHQVDAYISESTEFHLMSLQGLQFRYIKLSQFASAPESCFVTTQAVLQDPQKTKTLVGIARAFVKGINFGIANPTATAEIVCADLPQTCQDKEKAKVQVKDTVELATPYNPSVPPGGIDMTGWKEAARVALQAGEISHRVDVSQITDTPETRSARNEILNFDAAKIRQAARNYNP